MCADENPQTFTAWGFYVGADDAIRTRDLILTKDVLYRLSYISIVFWATVISYTNPAQKAIV